MEWGKVSAEGWGREWEAEKARKLEAWW